MKYFPALSPSLPGVLQRRKGVTSEFVFNVNILGHMRFAGIPVIEVDLAGSEGLEGMQVVNIKPQRPFRLPVGHE